jgi:hypothetical protein
VHLSVLNRVHTTDGYRVLLVIPQSLVGNNRSDVLRKNYGKIEIPEDGIDGRRNALEWKLV